MSDHISDSDLIDFIGKRLDETRTREIQVALETSDQLMTRYTFLAAAISSLDTTVSQAADRLDSSFLTDNIMRAVRNQAAKGSRVLVSEFVNWIRFIAKPVVAACVVLILMLATYNYMSADQFEEEVSTAEAMLGLPPVTIASAYSVNY